MLDRHYHYELPREQIGIEDLRLWLGYHCRLVRYVDTEWGRKAKPTVVEILPSVDDLCRPNSEELGFAADELGNPWRYVSKLTNPRLYKWKGHMSAGWKREGFQKHMRAVVTAFPTRTKTLNEWNELPNVLIASSLCLLRLALKNMPQDDSRAAECAGYLYQGLSEQPKLPLSRIVELQNKAFFAAGAGPNFVGEA